MGWCVKGKLAQDMVVRNCSLRRALKRAAESVRPTCPVIEMSRLSLDCIKIRTNRSLSISVGSCEVPAFARRVEEQFEIRWRRSQRDNQRLCKGPPQRVGSANLNNLCEALKNAMLFTLKAHLSAISLFFRKTK